MWLSCSQIRSHLREPAPALEVWWVLTDVFSFSLSSGLASFAVLCLTLFAAFLCKLESCGLWAAVCSRGWRGFSLYLSSAALPYSLAFFFFFFPPGLLSHCFPSLCFVPLLSEWPDSGCVQTDPWNIQYLRSPGTTRHRSCGICLRYDWDGCELSIILHAVQIIWHKYDLFY